ncbi:MAG: hypothetical protein HKN76_16895, partial [Saprospiraceae bacterium]|nr:hypothetical protein [Saprospiraceae bacterium]
MTSKLLVYLITLVVTVDGFNLMGQDHIPIFSEKEWKAEIVDLPGIGSNNIFEEMVQDSFGFLWIGSGDGLIRYDGHRTKIFVHDPNNANSLASNDISELLLQDNRYLWIGYYSNGGLDRMDLTSGRISHYLDSASVTEIIRDNNGFIWEGSIGGLYRIYPIGDSIQISQYFLEDTSNERVWTIIEDRNGAIWAGTGIYNERGHIYKYIPEIDSFQQYVLQFDGADEVFDSPVSALLEDSHHKLWGGTSGGNVFQIDRQTSQVTYLDLNLPTNRKRCIGSIFEDFDQKIWIVTAGGGLFRIDPSAGEQMHFGTNSIGPEIPSDIGWTICQSQDSILWIGGGRAGGILFKVYKSAPQLTNIPLEGLSTYSFLENSSTSTHEIYIGTDDGIVFYDLENGIKQHYAQDLLLPQAKERIVMHNLRRGHDASLWVACLSSIDEKFNGLLKVDPNSQHFRFYPLPIDTAGLGFKMRSYNYNTIRDFEFLNTGKILVATLGSGLYLFDPESEQFVHNQDFPEGFESLPSDFISDLYKDHQGAAYITGWKRGTGSIAGFGTKFLARLDPDFATLVNLELPASIKRPTKRCFEEIFSAGNDGIWLQSRRDGFIRLDTSMHATRIANPLTSDLLPVDISIAIKVDDQFWIKSQNLIYHFNPAIGKITSNFIACAGSGLARNQFNYRKALQLKDGTMLFGAENGFQRLDPQLSHRSMNSRVTFSSIQILKEKSGSLNKSLNFLSSQQEIILKHDENSIVIDFFIPDYRDPKNNQYEFKLDDYESDWQEVDVPKASYRRLAPGQYRFRVRAKGYRYAQTVEGSILLTILPPWYWAWWSKTLYLLVIILSAYSVYRYQLKRQLALAEAHRLKELDTLKSRLYTNITHEFRTPLTVILGMADQLQEKVIETGKAGLHTIKRNGNRLLS